MMATGNATEVVLSRLQINAGRLPGAAPSVSDSYLVSRGSTTWICKSTSLRICCPIRIGMTPKLILPLRPHVAAEGRPQGGRAQHVFWDILQCSSTAVAVLWLWVGGMPQHTFKASAPPPSCTGDMKPHTHHTCMPHMSPHICATPLALTTAPGCYTTCLKPAA